MPNDDKDEGSVRFTRFLNGSIPPRPAQKKLRALLYMNMT